MQIGYVGLGAMGSPMAARFATRFDTRVFNRTTAVARAHARAHGTTPVDTLEALAGVDVICTCLPSDVEVAQVAGRLGPMLGAGTIWLDHTSGDPDGSRRIAETLSVDGVTYLDAPVSGGPSGAASGTLTVMVGGDADVLDRVSDLLDAVAARVLHVGGVGAGMAVKTVNQILQTANLWAAAEGLAVLARAGVSASSALDVLNGSTGRSFVTEHLMERATSRAFPLTFALGLLDKDVRVAMQLADSVGVDTPVLRLARERTGEAIGRLGGEVDYVELVRMVEQDAGIELR
jgi:3-hydroxyisobutyrate dehydrogenase